jgi:selenocysteine lyase/cysteine desulfurase
VTIRPETLREHYTAFLRPGRILLTGHSHQAWPDVARQAQLEAFDVAAEHVDDKWGDALGVADELRAFVAARIGAEASEIALASNTHELVARFLSAMPEGRRHVVTTTGEFHSARRQLARLGESGLEVDWVEALPAASLAERLAARLRPDSFAVLVSNVLFETASVVPHLGELAARARGLGAHLLVDAYHAFAVVPFDLAALGPDVFVTGGGYKYAQWGEGTCFLRVPQGTGLRPVYTGWFSDFAGLAHHRGDPRAAPVGYGPRPADLFAGSTYDPTSHYRARAVARFFDAHGLTNDALRALSLAQTRRLLAGLDGFDVRTPRADAERGGFVTVRLPDAAGTVERLRARGVFVDARGELLRLGPAPYLTGGEIDEALAIFRQVAR